MPISTSPWTRRRPGGNRTGGCMGSFRAGVGATEPFALTVGLAQHTAPRGPEQSLAGATLIGRGTTASATLELNGATGAQQPVRIIASGGLSDGAWRGSLVAASASTYTTTQGAGIWADHRTPITLDGCNPTTGGAYATSNSAVPPAVGAAVPPRTRANHPPTPPKQTV